MDLNHLKTRITKGLVLKNPGKGTSEITDISDEGISYKRGEFKIFFSCQDFFDALSHFNWGKVTSTDLRSYNPSVFNSKAGGHSCNCTFFFMILYYLGLSSEIRGGGVKGNPFFVNISLKE
jgi:hypothetical protein